MDQRQQASERIKQANNILVTVSSNPSIDQLAACIGLTLALNKMGKHATAVFSGQVPSTLEFLQPEKTIEKNTDSLRDFIISLDKSKADKLRYKVEDTVVKIFITPYRTSISDKDLEFSQGDFNVDVVVTLGVHNQAELDQAITTHGRILHDATIITLNTRPGGELGSVNWLDPSASSLSELAALLVDAIDKNLVDGQIATAFLTGIVSETERFSNVKTSPQTMSVSAELMGAGANQQLVAMKLEEPTELPPEPIKPKEGESKPEPPKKSSDGTLEIAHEESKKQERDDASVPDETKGAKTETKEAKKETKVSEPSEPMPLPEPAKEPAPQIHIDEQGSLASTAPSQPADKDDLEDVLPPLKHEKPTISRHNEAPKMVLEPPTLGTPLNAIDNNYTPGEGPGLPDLPTEESPKPASMNESNSPAVGTTIMPPTDEVADNAPGTSFLGDQPVVAAEKPKINQDNQEKTLTDIERDVHSNHLSQAPIPDAFTGAPPAMPAPPSLPAPAASLPDDQLIPNLPVNPVANPSVSTPLTSNTPATNSAPVPAPTTDLDSARNAVMQAINGDTATQPLEPIQALNAQPLAEPGGDALAATAAPTVPVQPWTPTPPAAPELAEVQKAFMESPGGQDAAVAPQPTDPNAPPPVPPPMMPPMPPSS